MEIDRDLEQYLNEKGWQFKLVEGGRQVRIDDECPFCGKRKHLYFSSSNTKWDCKRCGRTGNLLTMKRELGDLKLDIKPASDYIFYRGPRVGMSLPGERPSSGSDIKCHRNLMENDSEALSYLKDVRGITEDTIKKFKIGSKTIHGKHVISIPHYYNGELVCMKFRTIPPEKKNFMRSKDCPSVLFNGDVLKDLLELPHNKRKVILCEGETDAIALSQLGYKYVVASTTGAGKADWPKHWLEALESATTIYIAYDKDQAGEMGAKKAAACLGKYRCRRVIPPLDDCAKLIEAGFKKEDMDNAIRRSDSYEDDIIKPTSVYFDELKNRLFGKQPRGRTTGWVTIDAILGGIREGELTVLTGDTGSGKSTFSTALARNQALQSVPILVAPFEQHPSEIIGKLSSMESRKSVYDMSEVEIDNVFTKIVQQPIYFIDRTGSVPLGEIKDAIYLAVYKYGIKFIVLDHLHFFLDCKEEEERKMIDITMRSLATWCVDLMIHILLVVHPAKLGRDYKGRVRKVVLDDLKGSSEIKKTCWNGIRIHRDRKQDYGTDSDDVEISILKCRSPSGKEGTTRLYFDPNGELFLEGSRPDQFDEDGDGWNSWDNLH